MKNSETFLKQSAYMLLKVQYNEMKRKHPDAVFLFRNGRFYETFFSDAPATSEVTGITVNQKNFENGDSFEKVPYATFPCHALDIYLPKLIRFGLRVCICDPLEISKTKINEVVSPLKK